MYRELFEKYEGTFTGKQSLTAHNFSIIRTLNMANALGECKRGMTKINNFDVNIVKPSNYSSYGSYIFKPIYHSKKLTNYLYTKEELINEGYSLEEALKNVGTYKFMGKCHAITLLWLQLEGEIRSDIRAITSLVRIGDNRYYFHSYICYYSKKMKMDMIADFAQNIIMPKSHYDELILEQEINVLNYNDYLDFINCSGYSYECGFSELLYLGLVTLKKLDKQKKLINN